MAFEADQNDKDRATQIEVALIQSDSTDTNAAMKAGLEQLEIRRKSEADRSKANFEKR